MVNEIVLSILVFVSYNTGDQIIMVSQLILQMKNEFCGQKPDITDDNSTKQDKSWIFGGTSIRNPFKPKIKCKRTNSSRRPNLKGKTADLRPATIKKVIKERSTFR